MQYIKVGIGGAAGYTAGELIRLLVNHPAVKLVWLHSTSQARLPVTSVHTDLVGDCDLLFAEAPDQDVDVVFLCQGHGASLKYLQAHPWLLTKRIIDLSNDFRLVGSDEGLSNKESSFTYGLTDVLLPNLTSDTRYIANPGCFATAIQLALAPAAKAGWLNSKQIHINAVTGSTGAGQSLSETSHFSWRTANHSIYKAFSHQHEAEIYQTISQLGAIDTQLRFLPSRGAFARGIYASLYFESDQPLDEIKAVYQDMYDSSPFVHLSDHNPDLKQVVNTNKCLLYIEKHQDTVLIISVIDNLLKGASGQAIENMNLMFGLPVETGLKLKATAF